VKRIKVLIILKNLKAGGTENRMCLLAANMDRSRFDVRVAALMAGGELEKRLEREGIPSYVFSFPESPRSVGLPVEFFRLVFWMMKLKPQVVLSSIFWADIYGTLSAALNRVPVILSGRGTVFHEMRSRPLAWAVRCFSNLFAHGIIANSRAAAQSAIRDERLPPRKVFIIQGGVDLKAFRCGNAGCQKKMSDFGFSPGDRIVCMVANLWPVKRHKDLIRAFELVHSHIPNSALVLVGRDCGCFTECRALADSLGIGARVHFLGSQAHVAEILRAVDVGVLCSEREGFSNVILENMAAGIPMVVTDAGGNAEAVQNGINGFVVPVSDVRGLADSIVKLLSDDKLRARMGAAGRRIAEQRFSSENMARKFQSLFLRLLSNSRRPIGKTL